MPATPSRRHPRRAIALLTAFSFLAALLQAVGARVAFAAAGDIITFAGTGSAGYSGDGGQAKQAQLNFTEGVALDSAGDLYIADQNNNVIRKVNTSGIISTFAGNGTAGYSGDNGQATQAELSGPGALTVDPGGNVLISDFGNNAIREVNSSGVITTVAGNGTGGFSGDGGPATSASLNGPGQVVPISGGGFYFADGNKNVVRKVDASGTITTVAGTGVQGDAGDGGPATQAQLNFPYGLALDEVGDLYIGDFGGFIRMVDSSGTISTFAQNGFPFAMAYHEGNLIVPNASSSNVSTIDPTGQATVIAGGTHPGYSGDGGPATMAFMSGPTQVAVDANNDIFIADSNNSVVREVTQAPLPADLLILRMAATPTPAVGQQITYRISVSNPGSVGTAHQATVADTLPAGETFVSATASQGSCTNTGDAVSCPVGDLAPGAVDIVTIVASGPNKSTSLTNTATVSTTDTDPSPADNSATVTTFVDPTDVALNLSAPSTAEVPTAFAYTATVTNNGPNDATNTTVTDTLPPGLTVSLIMPSQGSCTQAGTTVTCNMGTVAAHASPTVTINVTPTNAGAGVTNDTASVTADQIDPVTSNNTASAQVTISGQGCGMVITTNTTLTSDIGPCAFHGIVVGANGITLNLNHHRVFGLGNGSTFSTDIGIYAGVVVRERFQVTVENGTVSGFDSGVEVVSGAKNIITGMTLQNNLGPDSSTRSQQGEGFDDIGVGDGIIVADSPLNKITNNLVEHNGPFDGIGVVGFDANSDTVEGNTVNNTASDSTHDNGQGIVVNAIFLQPDSRISPVTHDNVVNNTVTGSAGTGILINSDETAVISNNKVSQNGLTSTPGNGIEIDMDPRLSATTADVLKSNRVTGNGQDGIVVNSLGNQITLNTATRNSVTKGGFFDLHDANAACGTNVWSKNRFGRTSTISPACTGT